MDVQSSTSVDEDTDARTPLWPAPAVLTSVPLITVTKVGHPIPPYLLIMLAPNEAHRRSKCSMALD